LLIDGSFLILFFPGRLGRRKKKGLPNDGTNGEFYQYFINYDFCQGILRGFRLLEKTLRLALPDDEIDRFCGRVGEPEEIQVLFTDAACLDLDVSDD
jgi:hypothetical protein